MNDLVKRLATFLLVIGAFLLVGFIASDAAGITNFWLLVAGLPLTAWGLRSLIRHRTPPEKADRFRMIKRLSGKNKKKGGDGAE